MSNKVNSFVCLKGREVIKLSGEEFYMLVHKIKGFGYIVIRTTVQCRNFIGFGGASRQHNNGHIAGSAYNMNQFNTIPIGKSQIQQDQVGGIGGKHHTALFTGVGNECTILIGFQNRFDQAADVFFIFH